MLSVIIPAYNAENSLQTCVDSVLRQTLSEIDVILIDDGSTDLTSEICDRYAELDSRVRVIHQDNIGLLASREKGVLVARGNLIGFVDSDDWIQPEYFELLLNQLGDNDMIASGAIQVMVQNNCEEKKQLNHLTKGCYRTSEQMKEIYGSMLCYSTPFEFGVLPYMWNKIFRKKQLLPLLKKVNKSISDGEDVALCFPYMLQAKSIVLSNYCGYHYMVHDQSMSHRKREVEYYNESCLYKWLYEQFSNSEYKNLLIPQLNRYMLMMLWKRNPEIYIEANQFIFPVDSIPYASKLIIYGDGEMGRAYLRQVSQNKHCQIVAVADKKYSMIFEREGVKCIPPEVIIKEHFDYILISINNINIIQQVVKMLSQMGVPDSKIIRIM